MLDPDSPVGREFVALLGRRDPPVWFETLPAAAIAGHSSRLDDELKAARDGAFVVNTATVERAELQQVTPRVELSMVRRAGNFANATGAALIHLSSSRVFDNRRERYREGDRVRPADGTAKLLWHVEKKVRKRVERHIILRTGAVIGYPPRESDPLGLALTAIRRGIDVPVQPELRTAPVAATDIARVLFAIVQQLACGAAAWGTYHYCGDAADGREFADAVVQLSAPYRPGARVATDDPGRPDPSGAGHYPPLDCRKIRDTFGIRARPWRQTLAALIADYWNDRPDERHDGEDEHDGNV